MARCAYPGCTKDDANGDRVTYSLPGGVPPFPCPPRRHYCDEHLAKFVDAKRDEALREEKEPVTK